MSRVASAAVRASDQIAQHQPLLACQRALQAPGWEQRLAPLAKHLADHNLVRARSYAGAIERHIAPHVLRDALTTMLEEQWANAYLIIALLIQERAPRSVARELGTTQGALLEMSRAARADLGVFYEDAAFAALGQGGREQARAGKRR